METIDSWKPEHADMKAEFDLYLSVPGTGDQIHHNLD